ncbi:hypothetical protein CRYUN_Cryun09bG0094900 [Craigia yunnanensis]
MDKGQNHPDQSGISGAYKQDLVKGALMLIEGNGLCVRSIYNEISNEEKGSCFVSSFNPLGIVIVAILGPFLLAEEMYLGRVIGSIVIIIGLYLVLLGKSKDQTGLFRILLSRTIISMFKIRINIQMILTQML